MICGCVWNVISSQMACFMRQWFSRSSELSNMAGKSSVEVLMEQNIYNWGMFNCHYLQILSHRIDVWYTVYANIWGILMVNVTIYSIHGSYGYQILSNTRIIVENPRSLHRWWFSMIFQFANIPLSLWIFPNAVPSHVEMEDRVIFWTSTPACMFHIQNTNETCVYTYIYI